MLECVIKKLVAKMKKKEKEKRKKVVFWVDKMKGVAGDALRACLGLHLRNRAFKLKIAFGQKFYS